MRKNQAAQSLALAFGLVGGLGFLGYTMLGDMLVGDPARSGQTAPAPTTAAVPKKFTKVSGASQVSAPQVLQAVSVPTAVVVQSSPSVMNEEPQTRPVVPAGAATGAIRPAHQPAGPFPNVPGQPAPAVTTTQQPTTARGATSQVPQTTPVQQVILATPPMPVRPVVAPAAMPELHSASVAEPKAKRPYKRRPVKDARVAVAQAAPVAAKVPQSLPVEPAMPAPRNVKTAISAPTQRADNIPAPVERQPMAAQVNSTFTSKDEMAVTISGQKAWVQVSPTRTIEAKKGDVLPNLGKILEIRGNQVVAENGTLTTN